MKMYNQFKPIIAALPLILLIVWAGFAVSCERTESVSPSGNVTITVDTRAFSNPAFESTLKTIDLLVFDKTTEVLEMKRTLTISSILPSYSTSLTIGSGTKLFYVIGNKDTRVSAAIDNAMVNVATITSFTTDMDALWTIRPDYEVASSSMPFTCMEEFTPIVGGVGLTVNLELIRAMGKLELTLLKSAEITEQVLLHSVRVIRTPDKSALMKWGDYTLQGSDLTTLSKTWPINPPEIKSDVNPSDAFELTPWYLFEYMADDGYSQLAQDQGTSLEISFTVGGYLRTSVIPIVSYIDTNSNYKYCVRRNTIARMKAILKQGKIEVSYSIFDWNDGDVIEKETGEDTSNKNIYEWNEGGLNNNGEVELEYN